MKKILIAGATGFIGYHLAKRAIEKGYKVISISKKLPLKKRYLKKVIYKKIDLSKKNLKKKKISCDYVINSAGYGEHYSIESFKGKKNYLDHINILKNLIKLLEKKKIKKFIQIGTCFEYSPNKKKLNENYKCKPRSAYGLAKLKCTKYLISLFKKTKFPVTIFRVFQLYGKNQGDNRLIPYVIKNCKKNFLFSVTTGNQIRNFCFIDDFTDAVFKSLKLSKSNGKILNIGHNKSYSIKEVVNLITTLIGTGQPVFGKKKMHFGENKIIKPNINKIIKILDWYPKINLEQGIKKIIQ